MSSLLRNKRNRIMIFSFFFLFLLAQWLGNWPERHMFAAPQQSGKFYDAGFLLGEEKEYFRLYSMNPADREDRPIGFIRKSIEQLTLWEFALDPAELVNYGGMKELRLLDDLNGDQAKDLLGILSPPDTQVGIPAQAIAISGLDGKLLWLANLGTVDKAVAALEMNDINEDGKPDIIISTGKQIVLLSGSDGSPLKSWPDQASLLPAGDVNKDGMTDVFFLYPREIRLGLFDTVGGIGFYNLELFKIFEGVINIAESDTLDDLNHDGIPELLVMRNIGDKKVLSVLSGYDGDLIAEKEGQHDAILATGTDFNQNGANDLLLIREGGRLERILQVLDGKDGSILWTRSLATGNGDVAWNQANLPLAVIEDLNRDGAKEVAILQTAAAGTGLALEIYDIAGGWTQPYQVFTLQEFPAGELNRRWNAGSSLQTIRFGEKNYLVVNSLPSESGEEMCIIYDYGAAAPLIYLPGTYRIAACGNASLVAEDETGKTSYFQIVPPDQSIKVITPKEFSLLPMQLVKLEWQTAQAGMITRLYVDQVFVLETTESSAEVYLNDGNHTVELTQHLPGGEISLATMQVSVDDHYFGVIVIILLSLLAIGILFGLPWLIRRSVGIGGRNV